MVVVECSCISFGIFTLVWTKRRGLIFAIWYYNIEILASCHFILSVSSNLSSKITYFMGSPQNSNRSFTPHPLNHFMISNTKPNERILFLLLFSTLHPLFQACFVNLWPYAYSWFLWYSCMPLAWVVHLRTIWVVENHFKPSLVCEHTLWECMSIQCQSSPLTLQH